MTGSLDFKHKLDLAAEMELHTRVFHSSLLELARQDSLLGGIKAPSPPALIRDHQKWLVEGTLDSRWHYGALRFRASWWDITRGLGITSATTSIHLPGCHARYPHKPGPMTPDARPLPGLDLDDLGLAEPRRGLAVRGGDSATVTGRVTVDGPRRHADVVYRRTRDAGRVRTGTGYIQACG